MTTIDKDTIHRKTVIRHLLRRFRAGASAVKDTPSNLLVLVIYLLVAVLVCGVFGLVVLLVTYGYSKRQQH